jgi:hypothetical protein
VTSTGAHRPGVPVRLAVADITEACEQIVCELLAGAVTADVYRFW